jgi:hypothetical protein
MWLSSKDKGLVLLADAEVQNKEIIRRNVVRRYAKSIEIRMAGNRSIVMRRPHNDVKFDYCSDATSYVVTWLCACMYGDS